MSAKSNLITLEVEGVSNRNGHVRFDELLKKLEDLLVTLNGIDRIVGNTFQPTLYYRVVKVKHSSPISITLEPVVRGQMPHRTATKQIRDRHRRFFKELRAISQSKAVSPDVSEQLLYRLEDLVEGRGRSFAKATLSNGEATIELDARFETNVRRLLRRRGRLVRSRRGHARRSEHTRLRTEVLDLSSRRPGTDKMREFVRGRRGENREALGRYVSVEGLKYFRAGKSVSVPDGGTRNLKFETEMSPSNLSRSEGSRRVRPGL